VQDVSFALGAQADEALLMGYALVKAATTECMGADVLQDEDEERGMGGGGRAGLAGLARIGGEGPPHSERPPHSMLGDITNVVAGSAPRPLICKPSQQLQQRARTPQQRGRAYDPGPGTPSSTGHLQAKMPGMGSPAIRRPLKDVGSENMTSRQGIFEGAINAVMDATNSTGLDSQWTSCLAMRLNVLGVDSELEPVLRMHGWNGGQFAGPPDRQQLLQDLYQACARPSQGRGKPRRGGA